MAQSPDPERSARRAFMFWRRPAAVDVREELAFHVEMRTRELIAAGRTPDAARAEALRAFGDLAAVSAECATLGTARDRERDRREWLGELRQDAGYAVRSLRRAPGFTTIAVLTLALGIGATTAIFSAVQSVVLRPFPFAHPERVDADRRAPWRRGRQRLRRQLHRLAREPACVRAARGAATRELRARRRRHARPHLGRARHAPTSSTCSACAPRSAARSARGRRAGREHVVVLSDIALAHALRRRPARRRARDPARRASYTVVGVMPAGFDPTLSGEQLWVPMAWTPARKAQHDEHHNVAVGLLEPGTSAAVAAGELAALQRELNRRYPTANTANMTVAVQPLGERLVGDYRERLYVTLGAVAFVLLIACGNVANLLLARGAARAKELAVRAALGARRGRIVRQLLTESVVLGLAAAAVGLALAYGGIRVLVAAAPAGIPRLGETRVDVVVLAFAVGVALASSVVFGLAPSLRAARPNVQGTLREGGRGAGGVRDHVRQALVVAEVALACTLLAGAALLVRSALYLQRVPPGFDPAGVVTARVVLPADAYADPARIAQALHAMHDRLAATPGVRAASVVSSAPFGGGGSNGLLPEGRALDPKNLVQSSLRLTVPGYLATMRIPLVRGRDFTTQDVAGAPRVMIVSETLAKRAWPNEDPIGKRVGCCEGGLDDPRWKTVIGVAADVRSSGPAVEVGPEFYIPLDQAPAEAWDWVSRTMTVVARGDDTPAGIAGVTAAIRAAARETERDAPVYGVAPLRDQLRDSTAEARFNTLLLGILGLTGLALAMGGIYGVVAYFVTQRTQEIGVRLALGATGGDVVRLLTWQSARPILLGVALGVAGALVVTRLLRAAVFGVSLTDPASLAGAATVLCVAGLAAAVVPARRALRVAPRVILSD